jgi:hypothetical protein
MDTSIIVGIFTLAGVAIGGIVNYLSLEKSRRREREDLAQEEAMKVLNEFFSVLPGLQSCLIRSRKVSTKAEETALSNVQARAESRFFKAHSDLFNSYFKTRKYTKEGPILNLLKEFWKEVDLLDNLIQKTGNYLNYAEIKDEDLIKQLLDQINKIYQSHARLLDALSAN